MKIVGSVLVISAVLALNGCGTSKSIMSARYEKMETWQLCKKLLENDVPSFRISWVNEVIQKRGENCEPYIGKFSPPARSYSSSSSSSNSNSYKLDKLLRENQRKRTNCRIWSDNPQNCWSCRRGENPPQSGFKHDKKAAQKKQMWKDFNCSNAAWRKGYCWCLMGPA